MAAPELKVISKLLILSALFVSSCYIPILEQAWKEWSAQITCLYIQQRRWNYRKKKWAL